MVQKNSVQPSKNYSAGWIFLFNSFGFSFSNAAFVHVPNPCPHAAPCGMITHPATYTSAPTHCCTPVPLLLHLAIFPVIKIDSYIIPMRKEKYNSVNRGYWMYTGVMNFWSVISDFSAIWEKQHSNTTATPNYIVEISSLFKIQGLHTARRNSLFCSLKVFGNMVWRKKHLLAVISPAYILNSREMHRKRPFYGVSAKGWVKLLLSALTNFQDTRIQVYSNLNTKFRKGNRYWLDVWALTASQSTLVEKSQVGETSWIFGSSNVKKVLEIILWAFSRWLQIAAGKTYNFTIVPIGSNKKCYTMPIVKGYHSLSKDLMILKAHKPVW